tara:strand:+ start:1051 stop:2067 length:1017 start_codon:yes stop_codon:yes gene_type:complete
MALPLIAGGIALGRVGLSALLKKLAQKGVKEGGKKMFKKGVDKSMKDLSKGGSKALARGRNVSRTQTNIKKTMAQSPDDFAKNLNIAKPPQPQTATQALKNIADFAGSGAGAVRQTKAALPAVVQAGKFFGSGGAKFVKGAANVATSPISLAVTAPTVFNALTGGDEEEQQVPTPKLSNTNNQNTPKIETKPAKAGGSQNQPKGSTTKSGGSSYDPLGIKKTLDALKIAETARAGMTPPADPDADLKNKQRQNEMDKLDQEMAERKRKEKEAQMKRERFAGYGTRGLSQYEEDVQTTQSTAARERSQPNVTGLDYLRSGEEVAAQNRMRRFRLKNERA